MKIALRFLAVFAFALGATSARADEAEAPKKAAADQHHGVQIGLIHQGAKMFRDDGELRYYDANGKPGLGARGPLGASGSADTDELRAHAMKTVAKRTGTSAVIVSKMGAVGGGQDYLKEKRVVVKKTPFTRNNESVAADEVHANYPVGTQFEVGHHTVAVTHTDKRMGKNSLRIVDKERSTRESDGLFVRTTTKTSAKLRAKPLAKR